MKINYSKKVLIKISDCPMWMRDDLPRTKQEQTKLELKRKIFPFFHDYFLFIINIIFFSNNLLKVL